MPIHDGLKGQLINQSSIKNTVNHTQYFEASGAKNTFKCWKCKEIIRGERPAFCPQCGTPYPWTSNRFKDLIEMVEYFELNAEDAES